MNNTKASSFDLEKSLQELECIVSHMEKDTLGIESALTEFEKGVKIIRECQKALETAEQKVKMLVEKNGASELIDYQSDQEDE